MRYKNSRLTLILTFCALHLTLSLSRIRWPDAVQCSVCSQVPFAKQFSCFRCTCP